MNPASDANQWQRALYASWSVNNPFLWLWTIVAWPFSWLFVINTHPVFLKHPNIHPYTPSNKNRIKKNKNSFVYTMFHFPAPGFFLGNLHASLLIPDLVGAGSGRHTPFSVNVPCFRSIASFPGLRWRGTSSSYLFFVIFTHPLALLSQRGF